MENNMGVCGRIHKSSVPDDVWAELYLCLLESGRERASRYCLARTDVPGFIRQIREDRDPWWLLTWKDQIAGYFYLSDILGKSACIHYAFLPLPDMRHESGIPAAVALGRYGVSSVLYDCYQDGTPVMDTLVGKTPMWNKAAVKMLRRIGANVLGVIPAICHCYDSGRDGDGIISYFTRTTVRPEWAEY